MVFSQLLYVVRWLATAPEPVSSRLPNVQSAASQLQLSLCETVSAQSIVCSAGSSSGAVVRKRMQRRCPQPRGAASASGALWAAAASLQALQECPEQVAT